MPDQYGMRTDKEVLADRDKDRQIANDKMHADHKSDMEGIRAIEEARIRSLEIQKQQDQQREQSPTSSSVPTWVWVILILAVIGYFVA